MFGAALNKCAIPVGAGVPAKGRKAAPNYLTDWHYPEGRFFVTGPVRRNAWLPGCFPPGPVPRRYLH
ncbi:hypothetical protein EGJ15_11165 [Pseudomonas sp. p99-361]|nr:hypothetical protein EGJ15_11165 [Pseudomonas sp. p99-361]